MLDSACVEHQNNPHALNLETVQIRRLMEDIQSEIDDYLPSAPTRRMPRRYNRSPQSDRTPGIGSYVLAPVIS